MAGTRGGEWRERDLTSSHMPADGAEENKQKGGGGLAPAGCHALRGPVVSGGGFVAVAAVA